MTRLIEQRSNFRNDSERRCFALALTVALTSGCGFDRTGLSSDAGGEGGSPSVTSSSSSSGSGGSGGAISTTATSSASSSSTGTPCIPTDEICNDGIDNDCDEMTDCEDPDCSSTGFVCISAISSGWSAVAFSVQSRPSCPAGYATPTDIVSAPNADTACLCSCTQQAPATCSQGILGLDSNGTSCPGAPTFFLDGNDSNCKTTNLSTVKNGKVKIAPLPPTQGMCGGTSSSTILPPVQGRFCTAAGTGTGCAGGGTCVASVSAPFASCIKHEGIMACPAGFPNGHSVGTSATDTRSCSACACGTNATCANPKLTLYADNGCATGAHDLPVTGSCDPVNDLAAHNYNSYRYTAAVTNGSCQPTTSSTPTGSLTLVDRSTICCQ